MCSAVAEQENSTASSTWLTDTYHWLKSSLPLSQLLPTPSEIIKRCETPSDRKSSWHPEHMLRIISCNTSPLFTYFSTTLVPCTNTIIHLSNIYRLFTSAQSLFLVLPYLRACGFQIVPSDDAAVMPHLRVKPRSNLCHLKHIMVVNNGAPNSSFLYLKCWLYDHFYSVL